MPTCFPNREGFKKLVGHGATVPVFRRFLADELTPVAAFARMSAHTEHAFLLESVVGGKRVARYSFIGADPAVVFRVKNGVGNVEQRGGESVRLDGISDPLQALERLTDSDRSVPRDRLGAAATSLPRFTGGAVGFTSYDTIRYYERLPGQSADDRLLDDLSFGIYRDMVVYDHVSRTVLVIATARLDGASPDADYQGAVDRIERVSERLLGSGSSEAIHPLRPLDPDDRASISIKSNFTREEFESAVRTAKEYILAGDIFQLVLSQRLRTQFAGAPFDVYRALRHVNPSPFMFFLKCPDATLIGASPEILCRVDDGIVTNRPLAGTRRRGKTPEEDKTLESELLADPKDRAEHIMLVDLGRNDVGRVAEPGTVKLTESMTVERYSHVMHLSSNVTGRLRPGLSACDALRCALPVGTVSGAPKVRAMEIIDDLEPVRRGPYGGAVGYLDFSGNMDMCIALRTMVATPVVPAREGESAWCVDIQVGAGIVADSDPAAEFEETMNKARAQLAALGIASR
ncbi:MAG: anthranilate synthase component I [Phycisphaerae bacterium]|nr:anthranilate synthase component I [Phycisphaerae bacterium]